MPLTLQSFNFAIECDENELETYDVKQEGPNSTTASVASEAGKQFTIVITNNLLDSDLVVDLHIDGERVRSPVFSAGNAGQRRVISGLQTSATSTLPFKFQELELVDPDLEDAPVVSEMAQIGSIEARAFRCQIQRTVEYEPTNRRLHGGRVSERSKKAGWHHVSFADEVINEKAATSHVKYTDKLDAPCASVKVFYRPRELLMAQGVIVGYNIGAGISGGSEVDDRKRAREDGSSGPSKRRTGSSIKEEELSDDARAQRIQALEAELNSLKMARKSGSSVKHERAPSPIVVGQAAGEVVDLTLED